MGEGLEDPLPASPPQVLVSGGAGGYFGGGGSLLAAVLPEQRPELRREWRTPPLWGLRDSAPYMHDGRAATFAEAIAWHGGEAAQSAKNFRRLEKDQKDEVLAFLNCLASPTPESLWLENIVLVGDQ